MDEIYWGIVVAHIIEWAKTCEKIPWINRDTDKLNKVVSMLIAIGTGIGIHFAYDTTNGSLTITGLALKHLLPSIFNAVKMYIAQTGTYKLYIKAKENNHETTDDGNIVGTDASGMSRVPSTPKLD